jgi:hypothetical protein
MLQIFISSTANNQSMKNLYELRVCPNKHFYETITKTKTYFCHILDPYEHFTVNDYMFGSFFPALAARIRVKGAQL